MKYLKRLSLYLLRWQLSTPILFICVSFLPFSNLPKTIIANLIGGVIFFPVDRWIFKRKNQEDTNSKE